MFPMGIRIWDQNRMIYPVKFSVYLDLEKNISSIKTLIEGKKYQTFNYMMLTTGVAINGYIYEKDIVMIDGEDNKVGIVEFDKMSGAFVVKTKEGNFTVNEAMEFCEILGNVYEDSYLLEEYSLCFMEEIVNESFSDLDDKDLDEPIIKEIVINDNTEEKIEENIENIKSEVEIPVEDISTEIKEEVDIENHTTIEDISIEVIDEKNDIEIEDISEKIINEDIVEEIDTSEKNIVIEEINISEELEIEETNKDIEITDEILEEVVIEETEELIEITEEIEKSTEIIEEPVETIEKMEEPIETIEEIDEPVEIKEDTEEIIEIPEFSEEQVDSNLFIGAEDLPFLDDDDLLEEPIDTEFIPDNEMLEDMGELEEELPPDDIFGDGSTKVEVAKETIKEEISGEEIVIYAIGYCAVENGPGTYSYIINSDDEFVKEASGGLDNTILNRIQLIGVIEALKNIKECDSIKVYCDSKYVISPFIKGWIYKWQANDWKKDSDNKVLNCDLWEEIYTLTENFSIQWEFIKDIDSIEEAKKCSDNAKKEIEKYIK